MENYSKAKTEIRQKLYRIQKEMQPILQKYNMKSALNFKEQVEDLNAKILKITLIIMDQHLELYKYIEEMPVTIPDEKEPEITLKNLKAYYDSLNSLLNKYIAEHPDKAK